MSLALFDLDGTLIHSEAGIVGSMRYALTQMGHEPPPQAVLRTWIGPPLRQTFPTVVGDDPAAIEAAVAHYSDRFDSQGWAEYEVYAGIGDVIETLAARGFTLVVATTKVLPRAQRIVDHLPFGRHFSRVYAPTGEGRHSEKAQMIAQALADFGVAAGDAVMIGDRYFDIEGARANAVRSIGVTWGFGAHGELVEAGADVIATQPSELAALILAERAAA